MILWRALLWCLLLLATALATIQFWIPLFIYRPAALAKPDPRSWGLDGAISMQVRYGDRTAISGWWAPPTHPGNPVILIVHGRSANISARAPIMKRLVADGLGVLMFDYRGYGASTGKPGEANLVEDTRAAYRWLRKKGVPAGKIAVVGQSLGNSAAAVLAAHEQVGALILVAPFTSLPEALSERLPWLPVQFVPWTRNRFDVAGNLAKVDEPALLVVSKEDGLVPIANAERLQALGAGWMDVSPLRHDGMLLAIAKDGRLTRAIHMLIPSGKNVAELAP